MREKFEMKQFNNQNVNTMIASIDSESIERTMHELEQSFILAQESMGELTPAQQANILSTTYKLRRILLELVKEIHA